MLEYDSINKKYSKCKKCNYKTFGKQRTEIVNTAIYKAPGKRNIYYDCRNCHYKESEFEEIPQLYYRSSSSGSSSSGSLGSFSSFGGRSSGGVVQVLVGT